MVSINIILLLFWFRSLLLFAGVNGDRRSKEVRNEAGRKIYEKLKERKCFQVTRKPHAEHAQAFEERTTCKAAQIHCQSPEERETKTEQSFSESERGNARGNNE